MPNKNIKTTRKETRASYIKRYISRLDRHQQQMDDNL